MKVMSPLISIALTISSPAESKVTKALEPGIEIAPTVILLPEGSAISVKKVPWTGVSGSILGELARVSTPDRIIKAGRLLKIPASGSSESVKARSRPVIVISPPMISPPASTFKETPS
jgi:hypothetical protein